jgi:transketolase
VALADRISIANDELSQLCINSIRALSIDAVQKANSGHPGMPMGMAPIAFLLFTRYMRHNPRNPRWYGRDRFVLSAGGGSMLLYSSLYLAGYDLTLDDIKQFRRLGSRTPGHPEYGGAPQGSKPPPGRSDRASATVIVSMPSLELFAEQDQAYRESVLPVKIRCRLAIEAAGPMSWSRWVGLDGDVIGMTSFGASGPYQDVMKHFGFTVENVVERALGLLGK